MVHLQPCRRPGIILGATLLLIALALLFARRTADLPPRLLTAPEPLTLFQPNPVFNQLEQLTLQLTFDAPVQPRRPLLRLAQPDGAPVLLLESGPDSRLTLRLPEPRRPLRGTTPSLVPGARYRLELQLCDNYFRLQLRPDAPGAPELQQIRQYRRYFRFTPDQPLTVETFPDLLPVELSARSRALPQRFPALAALSGVLGIIALSLALFRGRASAAGAGPVRTRRLWRLAAGLAAGFALAFLSCLAGALTHGNIFPYNTFIHDPAWRFSDLFDTFTPVRYEFLAYTHPRTGNYFPLTYFLLYLFPSSSPTVLLVFTLLLFAAGYWLTAQWLIRPAGVRETVPLLLVLGLSYPLWLAVDRANVELYVYGVVALFAIACYCRSGRTAALLLALAINLKLYPGTLGVLLLRPRYRRAAVWCAGLSAALFLTGMWAADWNFRGLLRNLGSFSEVMLTSPADGLPNSHSLFALFRYGGHLAGVPPETLAAAAPAFSWLALLLFAGVVWYVLKVEREYWKQLFLLLAVAVTLPHVSFDYTLLLLTVPLLFFLRRRRDDPHEKRYLLLWVLLLIPLNYGRWPELPTIHVSVALKPLVILTMCGLIIHDGLSRNRPPVPAGDAPPGAAPQR